MYHFPEVGECQRNVLVQVLDLREREISNRELQKDKFALGLSGARGFPTILKDCRALLTNALQESQLTKKVLDR
jgi:hypothetical protein